jgi:SAM-dependent methyltransferase
MMVLNENEIYPDLLHKQLNELPYFRAFLRAIEARFYQNLDLPQPIFDLGAGDGHFAARTFQRKLEVGLDPVFVSLEEAHGYQAYDLLINALGDRIPYADGTFATVISNSVLEHIPDVDAVLREANRILKTGGMLVITVPNSNFTQYLSVARFFDRLGWKGAAQAYRTFFNKISRHYHPDDAQVWHQRLEEAGFVVKEEKNYFPPRFLRILEWGHYFGLPNWFHKKLFGRWVLFPNFLFVKRRFHWLYRYYRLDPTSPEGAYTYFRAQKS